MTSLLTTLGSTLLLATEGAEGLPADHIASKLAVPFGILIFGGAVYALLWSNYGAKKGALVYGTAMGGFCMVIGVFWWFGAPGTPVATGLQNFPGQPGDQYQAEWFAFEPGSEAAELFPATNDLGQFQSLQSFLGKEGLSEEELGSDPRYTSLNGDVTGAQGLMAELALRIDETGATRLGGEARGEYQERGQAGLEQQAGADADAYTRAEPFYTATPSEQQLVTESNGTFLTGSEILIEANYAPTDLESGLESIAVEVDTVTMFAFKEPSALWFPSAIWTLISAILFGASLFGLDRIEQAEKRRAQQVQEPEDLAVSIRQ